MSYTNYTTRQGQRWDTIANEVYGDPYDYGVIIEANPNYLNTLILPSAVLLRIPVKQATTTAIAPNLLPPWKR